MVLISRPIIHVEKVRKDYYQYKVFSRGKLLTKALKGLSFKIHSGEFVGLIGINGAGKSTLMRILTTNMEKSGGKVRIAGYDLDHYEEEIKKEISWMFGQDYYGIGWASLEKNMHLAAAFLGLQKEEAQHQINTLLKRFHLEEKRDMDVWRLSSGMLAKYSLAIALLKRPRILFLDEPLLGLDTYAKDEIREVLVELNKNGTTILYTGHQLHEVEKICKRLLIINEGTLLFDGNTAKLKRLYRDTHVLDLVCTGKNVNKALYTLHKKHLCIDYDVLESEGGHHTIKLYTPVDSKKMLIRVVQELKKHRLVVEEINAGLLDLEDVYRKLMKVDGATSKTKTLAGFEKTGEVPLKIFEKLLQHTNPKLRARACVAFWEKNNKKVQPILLRMLQSNKKMQLEALQVIGEIKDECFMEHVLELFEMKKKDVHTSAVIALAKMGNEIVISSLMKLLLNEEEVGRVLKEVEGFDVNVKQYLQEKVHKLSMYDKAYLQHRCKKMKNSKTLLEVLGLQHRDYRQWKREKFKKGIN